MPLSVAELELVVRLEDRTDGTTAVVDNELDCAVHHLEDGRVSASSDSQQQAGDIPWLDHHADVEVDSDPEPSKGLDSASFWTEEVAWLHLLRAGNHVAVLLPLA